jgi:8-oxo-dGTP diphosphatase
MRRWGEAVVRERRYRRRPGAYAILWRDGAVLLTLQAEPRPEAQLPGGGIDAGESPLAALHREVREETGWTIAGARRLGAFGASSSCQSTISGPRRCARSGSLGRRYAGGAIGSGACRVLGLARRRAGAAANAAERHYLRQVARSLPAA